MTELDFEERRLKSAQARQENDRVIQMVKDGLKKFPTALAANAEIERLEKALGVFNESNAGRIRFPNMRTACEQIGLLEKLVAKQGQAPGRPAATPAAPVPAAATLAAAAAILNTPRYDSKTLRGMARILAVDANGLSDEKLFASLEKAAYEAHCRFPGMKADSAFTTPRAALFGMVRTEAALKQDQLNKLLS